MLIGGSIANTSGQFFTNSHVPASQTLSTPFISTELTLEDATVSGEDSEEQDVGSGGDPEHLIIEDDFLDSAEELREHFDSR